MGLRHGTWSGYSIGFDPNTVSNSKMGSSTDMNVDAFQYSLSSLWSKMSHLNGTKDINPIKTFDNDIQNMILNTQLSGVLTNFCIKDGSFYYVINYDDTSGSTDSVTSGSKTGGRVINIFRDDITGVRSKKLKKVMYQSGYQDLSQTKIN